MPPLPTAKDNPEGLHQRYQVKYANGKKTSEDAEYFVLRLDSGAGDPVHRAACLEAIAAYANRIEATRPQLASEIRARWLTL